MLFKKIIFVCAGSSLLCGLFSTCMEQGLLSSHGGLLIAVASLVADHGLRDVGSIVAATGL